MSLSPRDTRLFDDWSLPVMMLDRDLRFIYANKAYLDAVHKLPGELDGQHVFDAFPESEDRVVSVKRKMLAALDGETTVLEAQPFHIEQEDGEVIESVWQATQDPLRDDEGNIIGLIQRARDITQQYQLEQRNLAIGHELSHRVKNVMAVVSSVARITGRNATNVQSFVKSFTARINAMSRTNDLLARGNWSGLDVAAIFEDELSPFSEAEADAFALTGPRVRLSINSTKDLSMVCHELATNAVKYGCLGKPGGHLSVSWRRKGDRLTIEWRETCPHEIGAVGETGFGTRLFDMLPHVTVERDFTPNGLHLTIRMEGETVFG